MKQLRELREGFTLVELLIVIAIIGALSATMSVVTSNSTAKAKAAAIVSNVNACRSAAALYIIDQGSDALDDLTADDVLNANIPQWTDFNRDGIKYAQVSDGKGVDGWAITVDFEADPERKAIKTELQKMKGYYKYKPDTGEATEIMADDKYAFKVMLTSGKILPES